MYHIYLNCIVTPSCKCTNGVILVSTLYNLLAPGKLRPDCVLLFFFLTTVDLSLALSHKPREASRQQLLLYAQSPVSASEACKSLVSWRSLSPVLHGHSVFEDGLGRFTAVPYSFHFLIVDLTVLQGIFNDLEVFLYPSPALCFSITIHFHCLESAIFCYNDSQKLDLADKAVFILQSTETT